MTAGILNSEHQKIMDIMSDHEKEVVEKKCKQLKIQAEQICKILNELSGLKFDIDDWVIFSHIDGVDNLDINQNKEAEKTLEKLWEYKDILGLLKQYRPVQGVEDLLRHYYNTPFGLICNIYQENRRIEKRLKEVKQ